MKYQPTVMLLRTLLLLLVISFSATLVEAQSLLGAKQPQVVVKQVTLLEWIENAIKLSVTFAVTNPNDFSIELTAIRYKMLINDQLVAKDWYEQDITLNPLATTSVTLPVSLELNELFNAAPDMVLTNQLRYQLDGAVVVKDLPLHIPFSYNGSITLIE